LLGAALAFAGSFALLVEYWHPGRGVGSSLYLAIVLTAMATEPLAGAAGGALATLLYWVALIGWHDQPISIVLSVAGVVHLANFVIVGVVVGYFARESRRMLGTSLHLLEDLLDLAHRDTVTATANAAGFEAAASTRLRERQPFALLVGSPPQQGHDEDELRRIASVLGDQVERDDQLARIGAAEFALLVPCAHAQEAHSIGPRLERALDAAGLRMTFGWATPGEGSSVLELYAAAAGRLYARRAARSEWHPTPVSAALVDDLDDYRRASAG
jgi:GGDEF domain-containing protein